MPALDAHSSTYNRYVSQVCLPLYRRSRMPGSARVHPKVRHAQVRQPKNIRTSPRHRSQVLRAEVRTP